MSWVTNPIMEWWDDRDGSGEWVKISDHGRAPLSISVERIENKQRMANGRLRRYVVAKKRTFSTSWENFPSVQTDFLANGKPADWMEDFHNAVDGSFKMRLRAGSDKGQALPADLSGATIEVMITDFSKDIVKRGPGFDLLSISMTLEEV